MHGHGNCTVWIGREGYRERAGEVRNYRDRRCSVGAGVDDG